MARLPIPGSDLGSWGNVLNDYLSESHNTDGTLKDATVGVSQLSTTNSVASGKAIVTNGSDLEWQSVVSSVDGQSDTVNLNGKYIQTPQVFTHDTWASKSDGMLSGTQTDSGQTWQVTGTQPLRVRNHRLTLGVATIGAGYGQISLGQPVWQTGVEFVFETGSTSTGALTLIVADTGAMNLNNLACHFTVNPTNWVFEVRQNSGSLVQLATGAFSSALVADGQTLYRSSVTFIGTSAFIALPDGQVAIVSDSRIASFNQGHCIWEIITNASTDKMPAAIRIWAATSPDREVPFAVDSSWIRAVDRLAAKVLDATQNNVTSQRGTANEVKMGDLGGFAGVQLGGDTLLYRAGANALAINSAAILAGAVAHTGSVLGFYGAPVTGRPALTYSRTSESTAEAQLRTALATLGLVLDNTTT